MASNKCIDSSDAAKSKGSTSSKDGESDEKLEAFNSKYELLEGLGAGSFGDVFNGFNKYTQTYVAIKVERSKPGKSSGSLQKEADRYAMIAQRLDSKILSGLPEYCEYGVPKCYDFYKTKTKTLLVMQKLGPSLETLFNKCKRKFSLKTVCQIGIQMIDRIQTIHAIRMLHRDIKPDNFVIGCDEDPSIGRNFIRIIDFGLSKDYVQPNGKHIEVASSKELVGTVRYVSLRVHEGIEQSRRDDIEAIGHVLIYFLKRGLPWMGINPPENLPERQKAKVRYKMIGEKKKEIGIDRLCKGLPEQFNRYMEYARNEISFEEKPDYDFLRTLFISVVHTERSGNDDSYDWDNLMDHEDHDYEDQSSTNKPAQGTHRTGGN